MTTTTRTAKLGDIVRVTWHDAWADNAEDMKTVDEFEADCPVVTIGVLVRTGEVVSVSPETVRESWHRGTTHIPVGCVVKIEALTGA